MRDADGRLIEAIVGALLAAALLLAAFSVIAQEPAFSPRSLFGYFRDRYGSIAPGAMLHVFYNAGRFLLAGS